MTSHLARRTTAPSATAVLMPARGSATESVDAKVARYHRFVEHNLHPSLASILAKRDSLLALQSHWAELQSTIQTIVDAGLSSMKSQINIGCDFYMQALVPSTQHVFVDIGLGFHCALTLAEAQSFATAKIERLDSSIEECDQQAAVIQSHIKIVVEGIGQLMNLSDGEAVAPRKQRQDLW